MTDRKLQNSAPKRIYLDIGDQFDLERVLSGGLSWQSLEGVSWSEDNATSHGIPYVRADLASSPAAASKPLDDPKLQQAFGDAIEGALAFGFQGNNAPPEGHWLTRFWNIGRAEAAKLASSPAVPSPIEDGYTKAFYEIASVLGIGARDDSPENVFRNEMLPRILALAALPQTEPTPKGWKMVPIEATPRMWTAGGDAVLAWVKNNGTAGKNDAATLAYRAMLDAAPSRPQTEPGAEQ